MASYKNGLMMPPGPDQLSALERYTTDYPALNTGALAAASTLLTNLTGDVTPIRALGKSNNNDLPTATSFPTYAGATKDTWANFGLIVQQMSLFDQAARLAGPVFPVRQVDSIKGTVRTITFNPEVLGRVPENTTVPLVSVEQSMKSYGLDSGGIGFHMSRKTFDTDEGKFLMMGFLESMRNAIRDTLEIYAFQILTEGAAQSQASTYGKAQGAPQMSFSTWYQGAVATYAPFDKDDLALQKMYESMLSRVQRAGVPDIDKIVVPGEVLAYMAMDTDRTKYYLGGPEGQTALQQAGRINRITSGGNSAELIVPRFRDYVVGEMSGLLRNLSVCSAYNIFPPALNPNKPHKRVIGLYNGGSRKIDDIEFVNAVRNTYLFWDETTGVIPPSDHESPFHRDRTNFTDYGIESTITSAEIAGNQDDADRYNKRLKAQGRYIGIRRIGGLRKDDFGQTQIDDAVEAFNANHKVEHADSAIEKLSVLAAELDNFQYDNKVVQTYFLGLALTAAENTATARPAYNGLKSLYGDAVVFGSRKTVPYIDNWGFRHAASPALINAAMAITIDTNPATKARLSINNYAADQDFDFTTLLPGPLGTGASHAAMEEFKRTTFANQWSTINKITQECLPIYNTIAANVTATFRNELGDPRFAAANIYTPTSAAVQWTNCVANVVSPIFLMAPAAVAGIAGLTTAAVGTNRLAELLKLRDYFLQYRGAAAKAGVATATLSAARQGTLFAADWLPAVNFDDAFDATNRLSEYHLTLILAREGLKRVFVTMSADRDATAQLAMIRRIFTADDLASVGPLLAAIDTLIAATSIANAISTKKGRMDAINAIAKKLTQSESQEPLVKQFMRALEEIVGALVGQMSAAEKPSVDVPDVVGAAARGQRLRMTGLNMGPVSYKSFCYWRVDNPTAPVIFVPGRHDNPEIPLVYVPSRVADPDFWLFVDGLTDRYYSDASSPGFGNHHALLAVTPHALRAHWHKLSSRLRDAKPISDSDVADVLFDNEELATAFRASVHPDYLQSSQHPAVLLLREMGNDFTAWSELRENVAYALTNAHSAYDRMVKLNLLMTYTSKDAVERLISHNVPLWFNLMLINPAVWVEFWSVYGVKSGSETAEVLVGPVFTAGGLNVPIDVVYFVLRMHIGPVIHDARRIISMPTAKIHSYRQGLNNRFLRNKDELAQIMRNPEAGSEIGSLISVPIPVTKTSHSGPVIWTGDFEQTALAQQGRVKSDSTIGYLGMEKFINQQWGWTQTVNQGSTVEGLQLPDMSFGGKCWTRGPDGQRYVYEDHRSFVSVFDPENNRLQSLTEVH
jgi:hypothetical protein